MEPVVAVVPVVAAAAAEPLLLSALRTRGQCLPGKSRPIFQPTLPVEQVVMVVTAATVVLVKPKQA